MRKLVFIVSVDDLQIFGIEKFFEMGFQNNNYDKVYVICMWNNRMYGYMAKGYSQDDKEYYQRYINDIFYDAIIDKEREELFSKVLFTDFNEDDNIDIMYDSRYTNIIKTFRELTNSKVKVLANFPQV